MLKGFKILEHNDCWEDLLEYREKGALRGVYLGFPNMHEHYTMSLPGCTDWTGFPQSGKSELLLEVLLNTTLFYGWKHLIYVPDVGSKNEVLAILMHKITGKTFDKRYVNTNYISEDEINKNLGYLLEHFKILHKEDINSKITPYEFWNYAAHLNSSTVGGIQTATIDSWKDMKHGISPDGSTFSRDDKYLEDVLSYRNAVSEREKMHFHIVIHPRSGTEKDANGKRKAPKPDELKGGPEWWNSGKVMLSVHRVDGSKNEVDIIVTKAKPKSVAKQGKFSLFLDVVTSRYYFEDMGEKKYAEEKYIKPIGINLRDKIEQIDEGDDFPF